MEELKTTVIDYGGGIYAIDQQMVRAFLIVGTKRALLLDTGALRWDIPACLRGITALPLDVALTHGDGDHIANLPDFSDAFVHPADAGAVRAHQGCEGVRLHPLAEGDVFDVGGRRLRVLATPGHTGGSVCLLEEEHKLLFSGDTLSYGPVFMFGERRDMPAYLQSLRRLKKLKDDGVFETVYCCHNTCPITADTVEELIACAQGIRDKTLAGASANMPLPMGEKPYLYRRGACAILADGPEQAQGDNSRATRRHI